jgi:hypothetical protein
MIAKDSNLEILEAVISELFTVQRIPYLVFLFNTAIYVFLSLHLCILIVWLRIFIVPAGTLRLPWLRFFRAFSSVVRQMPGYNMQRRGTARTLPKLFVLFYVLFVLCHYVYCLCVNVYCTNATGWQPNCSLTNISYIISILRQLLRIFSVWAVGWCSMKLTYILFSSSANSTEHSVRIIGM